MKDELRAAKMKTRVKFFVTAEIQHGAPCCDSRKQWVRVVSLLCPISSVDEYRTLRTCYCAAFQVEGQNGWKKNKNGTVCQSKGCKVQKVNHANPNISMSGMQMLLSTLRLGGLSQEQGLHQKRSIIPLRGAITLSGGFSRR